MLEKYLQNIANIPRTVSFNDIKEFDRFEERFFDVEGRIGDIVGMLEGAVEFCPNNDPPSQDEILAWLWVIKPEFKKDILSFANDDLREIITDYDLE